jgi:hypothetical protein
MEYPANMAYRYIGETECDNPVVNHHVVVFLNKSAIILPNDSFVLCLW